MAKRAQPGGVRTYLFASMSDNTVCALTTDPGGGNLPPAYAPWRPINGGAPLWVSGFVDEIGRAIHGVGYYILVGEVRPGG